MGTTLGLQFDGVYSADAEQARTEIAFDFVRHDCNVPKLIWKQLLSHSTSEQLEVVLDLKTGLIKRDINWLSQNRSILPIDIELVSLYQKIVTCIYDLDAMDYLITRLIVRGVMTQELSVLVIDYLHSVLDDFSKVERQEILRVRDSLLDWNRIYRGVGSMDNKIVLKLLGIYEHGLRD
jgi:hypothetical protein